MYRTIIEPGDFEIAQSLYETLRSHRLLVALHKDVFVADVPPKCEYFVASAAFESKAGGTRQLIELARKVGAKSLVVICEGAERYRVESELNGKLLRVSFPKAVLSQSREYMVLYVASLLHGTGLAVPREPVSCQLFELAERVARADVSVFINGPTGSGKEVLSNFIHNNSSRDGRQFVAINCAAIPENMLEAMLFGHEKGSFTGASTANVGIIRAADGGTLLLDEVSEMSLGLQAKLLRALQEKAVTPVGGTKTINVDVRVLSTSNRNMIAECQSGRFREDLFYRLNVFPLTTIALSQRKKDILPIAIELLLRHYKDLQTLPMLADCAIERLQGHNWPGNVRELDNVLQRATVMCDGLEIMASDILFDHGAVAPMPPVIDRATESGHV
ncbi:MAG: sigma-54 dependent transcriptional regulator [Paracoccaceae bacterium]|jgi:two-component system, response regulator FlrC|nr:sigma-54 dependent transcriptional regulator [Paracoccaceae bacterium]